MRRSAASAPPVRTSSSANPTSSSSRPPSKSAVWAPLLPNLPARLGRSEEERPAQEEKKSKQYYENRLKTLDTLKAAGANPYPHKFLASISVG
ncbi:hypothetical protein ZWY2020_057678 [Hordeum vulgare]|nr:hypothetical protein ZWY2020_057678 [Hordeum vulgare]